MKKFLIAALLVAPGFALFGCQDSQADIASLKIRVAQLEDENSRLHAEGSAKAGSESGESQDVGLLLTKLERQQAAIDAANARIAELEKKPAPAGETVAADGDFDKKLDEALQKRDDARKAERDKQQAEEKAQREAQMQVLADKLKEAGIDFDPKNPRESGMQIWMDETKRNKAFGVFRDMMNNQRLDKLGLDERQKTDVLRIEADARQKTKELVQNLRDSGGTPEEIQAGVKQVQEQKNDQLKSSMTPEQYDQYQKEAATGGMMPDNLEDLQGLLPGMGLGGGGGRGWGGGGGGGGGGNGG